jgi:hypothetical protein
MGCHVRPHVSDSNTGGTIATGVQHWNAGTLFGDKASEGKDNPRQISLYRSIPVCIINMTPTNPPRLKTGYRTSLDRCSTYTPNINLSPCITNNTR